LFVISATNCNSVISFSLLRLECGAEFILWAYPLLWPHRGSAIARLALLLSANR
jgi:hypothetical protein